MLWEKIEFLLDQKNMTAYRLSKLSGISKENLSQLKLGKLKSMKFETVVKIADALDVSLDEFR